MSVSYCEKHDLYHDEDYQTDCPKCESESVEHEALQDEDPNGMENLLKSTGWRFHTTGTNEERAKARARRFASEDHLLDFDADPTRHGALLTSSWAGWYLDEYNKIHKNG